MPEYIVQKQTESRKKNGCYNWSDERKTKHKIFMKGKSNTKEATKQSALKRRRPVLQYDLNYNFIQEWPSIKLAKETLQISSISDCLAGRQKRAGQFIFKFKEVA